MKDTSEVLSTPPKPHFIRSKRKIVTPSTNSKDTESVSPHHRENHTMVKMIGHHRLLQTFNNTPNKSSNWENLSPNIVEDRFIPSRKLLQKQFSRIESENDCDIIQIKDPQIVSVAQIYYEQILGASANETYEDEHEDEYKNSNLLKYRYSPYQERQDSYKENPNQLMTVRKSYQKCRKITKTPCKVLDAPALQDDFYLNLIDWSMQNQLAVGLGNCIYLWNAETSKVTKLCELAHDNSVTSVCWANKGSLLAIGCNKGDVLVWDVNYAKQIRKMGGHDSRVGAMTWNSKLLATGSRDKTILERDVRVPTDFVYKMSQHSQEICGLKWSDDEQYLASGGNDNKVVVWGNGQQIINKFTDHKAAVKALAWSPHQHGLLATGGGTADRMIKMRNVFTGEIICEKDAGSQVCNIAFSKSLHEVVSTHGYSQNEINIWSWPTMRKTATLIGHSQRVLYLATSPDGSTIVTGAGDETLRFWNVFPSVEQIKNIVKNVSSIESGITLR